MHLNSGLLLRQKGESAYAAVRRFALANPDLRYLELTREARQRLADVADQKWKGPTLLVHLAYQTELRHCEQYGLPLPQYAIESPNPYAADSDSPRISRNCPQCARVLFHSSLYELPWLAHCPIHHCPIMDTCPTCQQPWPSVREFWKRGCPICGLSANREALVEGALRAEDWSKRLQPLQRAIDYRGTWAHNYLWAGADSRVNPYEIYTHGPINLRDDLYPSIISDFDSTFRAFCVASGIPIEECVHFTFGCTPTQDDRMRYDPAAPPPSWVRHCRSQVGAKIAATIARCAGSAHRLTPPSHAGEHPPQCAFCSAYLLWYFLSERPPLRHSDVIEKFMTTGHHWFGVPPAPPQPLSLLTIQSLQDAYDLSPTEKARGRHFELPQAAQRLLYTFDLWAAFIVMFRYAENVGNWDSDPEVARVIEQQYPTLPNFSQSISDSLAFWENSADETLHLRIPKSLLRPRLETALSAHWVQTCTTQKSARTVTGVRTS